MAQLRPRLCPSTTRFETLRGVRFSGRHRVAGRFSALSDGQTVDLDTLLTRATRYVGEFVYRFSNVVAEETYLQETIVEPLEPDQGRGARCRG